MNMDAPTQAAALPKRLSSAALQRRAAMTLVSVVMAVNLKNAVVKIYSAFLSSLLKDWHFGFHAENTMHSTQWWLYVISCGRNMKVLIPTPTQWQPNLNTEYYQIFNNT